MFNGVKQGGVVKRDHASEREMSFSKANIMGYDDLLRVQVKNLVVEVVIHKTNKNTAGGDSVKFAITLGFTYKPLNSTTKNSNMRDDRFSLVPGLKRSYREVTMRFGDCSIVQVDRCLNGFIPKTDG